jgi:uncharacterized protein DUF1203
MTTMTCSYEIRAIEPAVAAALRDCDDAGNPPRMVTDHDGGSPLRCCLRPSDRHEPIALVAYAPLRRWAIQTGAEPGPYDEVGPVFIHPQACRGPAHDGIPAELCGAARVFRGYNADGAIVGGRLVAAGERPDRVLEEMFVDPAVALVHVRALEFGCFTFEVRRVTADRRP